MKPIIPLIALICTTLLASCGNISRLYQMQPSSADTLRMLDGTLEDYEEKYGEYDGVFLDVEESVEHWAEYYRWQLGKMRKLRYLLLNPNAEWLTTFNLSVDRGTRVEEIYIQISSPDGDIRKFTMEDLRVSESSDGSTVYKLAYPDVKKGSIIEEGILLTYQLLSDRAAHEIPLQYSVPCERLKVHYTYPDWWRIIRKKIGPETSITVDSVVNDDEDRIDLAYHAVDISPIANEPYSPFFKEMAKYMEMRVKYAQLSDTYYTGAENWEEVAEQFEEYAIDRESFWSGAVGNQVEELVTESMPDTAKLDAIVTWVQQNIKVGPGGLDDDFSDLMDRKQGNPYLICGLAVTMLGKAGIKSDFLLVHSARDGYFDPDYIAFDQLPIPAVAATIGSRFYVVFPFWQDYPVDQIPDYLQGQKAMRINEEGEYSFIDIPWGSIAENTVVEDYHLKIDEMGTIEVREEKTFRGTDAYSMRRRLRELKEDEVKELMQEVLTYTEGDVQLDSYEIENLENYKQPLRFKLAYHIDNLVTVTPEEVIFQTGGLFSPASSQSYKIDASERRNPIRIYYDEKYVKNITIEYPGQWRLNTPLKDLSYENLFGYVNATYREERGAFRVAQTRLLRKAFEPKEEIDKLLEISGKRSRLHIPTLIFGVSEM